MPEGSPDLEGPDWHGYAQADRAERLWNLTVLAAMGFIILFAVATGFRLALSRPSNVQTIDRTRLHLRSDFIEKNLGIVPKSGGSATVRFVAEQFGFVPSCLMVPAGRMVTFRTSSADVIHGSNANTLIVPGFVSQIATRFDKSGKDAMPCQEFCGIGHHAMWDRIHVVPLAEWPDTGTAPAACPQR